MSNQLILVLNCGSSSLKGAVIDRKNGKVLLSCLGERLGTPEAVITFSKDGKKCQAPLAGRNCHAGAVGMLLKELEKHGLHDRIKAIGHRIAHGGEKYSESVLIDQAVMDELNACIPLAPLHNPANINGILAAQEHFPGLPNVGVMDTSFHQPCRSVPTLMPFRANCVKNTLSAAMVSTVPVCVTLLLKPHASWANRWKTSA